MFINAQIDIVLIAVVLSIISQVMSRKLVDRKKMKAQQAEMKEKNKRIKELTAKGDEKSKAEAMRMQQEMLSEMGATMKGSMRLLMFSMVVYLPMFAVIRWLYADAVIPLPVPIPWFGSESLIELYNETNWIGWYILCSLVFSLIGNVLFKLAEKRSS